MPLAPAVLAFLLAFAGPSVAQISDEYRWLQLGESVSVLQLGPRLTNVGVVEGVGSGLVVDSYLSSQAGGLVQEVNNHLGGSPDFVVTTHSHGDHWGANATFAAQGSQLIAQRNAREIMSNESWSIIREQMMPPAPLQALATLVVDDRLSLAGRNEVQLLHLPAAHTGGDLVVWIPEEDVLFAGDILAMGYPSLLDAVNKGTIDGLIAAQQELLQLTGENTKVVPGHGPVTDRRALQYSVQFMQSLRQRLGQIDSLPDEPADLVQGLPDLGQSSDPQRSAILVEQAFQSLN